MRELNKLRKIFASMLIIAVVSMVLTGCAQNGEHPHKEHPKKTTGQ